MQQKPPLAHKPATIAAQVAVTALVFSLGACLAWGQGGNKPAPPSTRLYLAALDAGPVAPGRGQLLGMVTDASGRAMAGAVVEVRAGGLHQAPQRQRTAADGLFRLDGMTPGMYYVQVAWNGQATPRQRVTVHASERALLLVDLPQLLRNARFGAPPGTDPDQAFNWALRQASIWRPILRWDGDAVDADSTQSQQPIEGYVALTAGGGGSAFAAPDLATEFRVDTRLFATEAASFRGSVGANLGGSNTIKGGAGDTRIEANFQSIDPSNLSRLHVALRQISLAGGAPSPGAAALPELRVFSANYANTFDLSNWLGDGAHLQYGAMVNSVSMTDTVTTLNPYLRAVIPMSQSAELEFRAASAVPPLRFGQDYAEMQDPTPQVTLDHNHARLEHAHHQEVRYQDSLTPTTALSAAVFGETFERAAINGTFSSGRGSNGANAQQDLLPDLFNNMFVANGGNYHGWGYRVVVDHQLGDGWSADLGWASGPALVPFSRSWGSALASSLTTARVNAITVKLTGTLPATHTSIVCSYRGLSRISATAVDAYDDTSGQSDAYANLYLRQPLPRVFGVGGSRIAALLEIHNLLAQGYIPMVSRDGGTLILVQNARAVRGGLTISF